MQHADMQRCADDKAEWAVEQKRLLRHRRKLAVRNARGKAPALSPDLWVTLAFHCATVANLESEIGIPSYAEMPEVCLHAIPVLQLLLS